MASCSPTSPHLHTAEAAGLELGSAERVSVSGGVHAGCLLERSTNVFRADRKELSCEDRQVRSVRKLCSLSKGVTAEGVIVIRFPDDGGLPEIELVAQEKLLRHTQTNILGVASN